MPSATLSRATSRRLDSWVRIACSASRRSTRARRVFSAGVGACQGSGVRSAQNWAISLASTLSVLVRTIREAPKALIWAGLTTLTVVSGRAARCSATASQ